MPNRGSQAAGYRYGFGGQEKDDEIYGNGNAYTAMFWEYDPRLGRRWNLDPLSRPYMSDYSTFGNNPIVYNDPNGDTFDPAHQKDAESHRATLINRSNTLEREIEDTGKQLQELKMSLVNMTIVGAMNSNQISEIKAKIGTLSTTLNRLEKAQGNIQGAICEWDDMNTSSQVFVLAPDNTLTEGGKTRYNSETKEIIINYNPNFEDQLGHELKHGYQFLQGKTSFGPRFSKGDKMYDGGTLLDVSDEQEAYIRQYYINPTRTGSEMKINNVEEITLDFVDKFIEDYIDLDIDPLSTDDIGGKIDVGYLEQQNEVYVPKKK